GKTRIDFEGGNVASLTEALTAMQDEETVKRLSTNSFEAFAQEKYSEADHLARLETLYQELTK
ncbi:MAG TPA: hypothetical protein VK171_13020, partial [Fimbriimonas sp.]|nr:hypothetical protein [Fimbriimonas sp.]